jgi:hypothetical protein
MYELAINRPRRDEVEPDPNGPPTTGSTTTPDSPSKVIPLPVMQPPDAEPYGWSPPKEVIWIGNPGRVLAMSMAIAARLSEAAAGSS